jgi:8-oxo-dGTP diphosphatase
MIKCTLENGDKVFLRHAVVDAVIIENNKILLVRRAEKSYEFPGKLALPGGYIDFDETVEQAVLREVQEETGYKAKVVKFLKYIDNPKRTERQTISFLFLLKPLKKVSESDNEVSEIKWFDINKLPPKEDFAFDHLKIIHDFLNK